MLALPAPDGSGMAAEGIQTSSIKPAVAIPQNSISTQMKQGTQTSMQGQSQD